MTSVFIVRPFGKKSVTVKDKEGKDAKVEVDFDATDRLLIKAALAKNDLTGQTTGVITQAGNIRLDMFQMLIAYDLVIADISVDNANVFYELGVRHGLRPNGTILIRFKTDSDVPFDLKTDRYIVYDRENPAAAADLLATSIRDTLSAMRRADRRPDSPVFLLLPALAPPDPAKLIVVPREFQEAVERAEGDGAHGLTMLALLGEEAKRTAWRREGVRLVARAQRRMNSFSAALDSWENIRKDLPDDVEANLQLATIFQRLGDLVSASQACRRVLENPSAERKWRADARSQLARNEKASWVKDFSALTTEEERRAQAISDNRLTDAFEGYMAGFAEDLNDYYSGINALGLLTAIVELAQKEPAAWANRYATERRATAALDEFREQLEYVRGAVRMSLDNAAQQAKRSGKPDEWLPPSDAQYKLLTANNPDFVRNAYKAAKIAGKAGFSVASEAAQVGIFKSLGLFSANCAAALEALGLPASPSGPSAAAPSNEPPPRDRIIVGTGHRADAPNREAPRFPNTPECIATAKRWLREQLEAEKAETKGSLSGIAGAASGTDLLFHEACNELGIPTTVVLPIPKEDYRRQSVADGGPDWVERFNRLLDTRQPIILNNSADMPPWAESIVDYGVFQRGNIWIMEDALLRPNADVTLLALWNGKAGDGPGGTQDMVTLAGTHSAKICTKNTDELFGLSR
jgi:hypothetical protein